jgi:ADP-ribose pyrophosphatase
MSFETIHSEIVYRGRAFDVRRDQVRLPNDNTTHLDIVDHQPAVTLLPIDDQGFIWFVRQYRYPAQQNLLELPAGVLEAGETPEACAHREIREETGMAAKHLKKIGEFFLAPGYSTEFMYVYKATGLHPAPLQRDADEFLTVERFSPQEIMQLVTDGKIRDSKSLTVLFLSRLDLSLKK